MILIDTDICVELLRGNQAVIKNRKNTADHVAISFITVGELYYGAEKSSKKLKNIRLIEEFLLTVNIVQSNHDIMKKFGDLKGDLTKQGKPLPDADIIIAATTLAECKKLVTGNITPFKRFDGLKTENWLK